MKAFPSKPGMMYISAENTKWHTILAVDHVLDKSLPISKIMTTMLRHSPTLRKPDGASHWQIMIE